MTPPPGVSVPDEVASNSVAVADLQRVLVDLLVRKGRGCSADLDDEVSRDLVKIIVDQTGLKTSGVDRTTTRSGKPAARVAVISRDRAAASRGGPVCLKRALRHRLFG